MFIFENAIDTLRLCSSLLVLWSQDPISRSAGLEADFPGDLSRVLAEKWPNLAGFIALWFIATGQNRALGQILRDFAQMSRAYVTYGWFWMMLIK